MRKLHGACLIVLLCCLFLLTEELFSSCGIQPEEQTAPKRVKRVIGGMEAPNNSWPWIVNFIDTETSRQQCAGSIIDREWILTAGHCFLFSEIPFPVTNYSYHVADHRLNFTDIYEYQVVPSQLYVHPMYILGDAAKPGDYDIALVKLAKPLNYSECVRPVCLPDKKTIFTENDTCYLAGWGNLVNKSGYHRSLFLKQAKLNLVSLERCNRNISYEGVVTDRFLCAGFDEGGVDGCSGDSGGPLQCKRDGVWIQAGIMSWGKGCAQPNHFGVYSDVKNLLPFITAIRKGANANLTAYYQKTLMEMRPNMITRGSSNLYKLFANEGEFSNVDLVRNLQLLPDQIRLLNKSELRDLVFVSYVNNLLQNATTLGNITRVFLEQAHRLSIYIKSKLLAEELNITFERVVLLSNLTKDDLLNAKASVLEKVRKMFYILGHLNKLRMYKKTLQSYQENLVISFNESETKAVLNALSVDDLKKLDMKILKLILVESNKVVFIKTITLRNISAFFEVGLVHLTNWTVTDVFMKILNTSVGDFATMYNPRLTAQQLNVIKGVKISSISNNSSDESLYAIADSILKSRELFSSCGIRPEEQTAPKRVKRVIGGMEAPNNSWPWIVNFIDTETSRQQCAGSIIDREWILTAGHCFLFSEIPFPVTNYSYHVADHRLNFTDIYEYQVVPSQLYVHPMYILGDAAKPGDYDIALVKLAKPLNYSECVRPVCLPDKKTIFTENDTCYLAGWGNLVNKSGYHRSLFLKQAKLNLVSLERCNRNISYEGVVTDRFLCAGFDEGGVDGCSGDSGGPLQCERNGVWIQAGIMSWGKGCAQPNHFGVYSDVKNLLPFITAIRKGANANLTAYYQKTLMEMRPNMITRGSSNLYKLFANEGEFSNVDLVRNLQLLPDQIRLLNKSELRDLVFVSYVNNLLQNATTLGNITRVFLEQAHRLSIYIKSKLLAEELNITFERVVLLSNLTKDDLLNAKASVLEKVRKMFYILGHLNKLRMYKKTLQSYQENLVISFNESETKAVLNALSVDDLKKLDMKILKLILVESNKVVFIKTITLRNISAFFEVGLVHLTNWTVTDVFMKILNTSVGDFATMYNPRLTAQQLNVIKGVKISSISNNSSDESLYAIADSILKSREIDECKIGRCSKHASCSNSVGSFSCRCFKGYVGDGVSCVTGNTIYKSELRINETFSPNLKNPDSYEYVNLAEKIQNGISQALRGISGFVGPQVTDFRSGSIVAEYVLVFVVGEKEKVNASQVTNVIKKAIDNGSVLAFAVSSSPLQLSSLCDLGSDNCHQDATCNVDDGRVTCRCRENFYGDGINCANPCQSHKCPTNSDCYSGLNGTAICICHRDHFMDEDEECNKINEYKVPLIIVSCVAGLLLLVLLVVLCHIGTRRSRAKSFKVTVDEQNNPGRSNTGYDDMSMNNF